MRKLNLLVLLGVMSFNTIASDLAVDATQIVLSNNEKAKKIVGISSLKTENPLHVTIAVSEVLRPELGAMSEHKEFDKPLDLGLYVGPGRMVLKKGAESQGLSIINVNQNLDKERIYRVRVSPSQKEGEHHDLMVYVQPDKPFISASYHYTGHDFIVKNTGNARFFVTNGKACYKDNSCYSIPSGYVYAGAEGSVPVAADVAYVSYDLVMVGQKTKAISFLR
jgi:hypothetical protein